MKFLADESVESRIVEILREDGFDVLYVAEHQPSIGDESVLRLCNREKRVLITNDKDFGELIFLERKASGGILLLRFVSAKSSIKAKVVFEFLRNYRQKVAKHFVVLSESGARIRKI